MRYKLLGHSGLRVSELCLGAMGFGLEWGWGSPEDECRRMFDAFVAAGGNFIDTANFYTNGTSEKYVGRFIAGDRQRFVVATKCTMTMRPDTAASLRCDNGSGAHVRSSSPSSHPFTKGYNHALGEDRAGPSCPDCVHPPLATTRLLVRVINALGCYNKAGPPPAPRCLIAHSAFLATRPMVLGLPAPDRTITTFLRNELNPFLWWTGITSVPTRSHGT